MSLSTIALIGPMGAGKTAVGARLAGLTGRKFFDTDQMVMDQTGRSVSQIFKEDSEAGFREKEARAVVQAVSRPGAVVACGGGAVLSPDNVAVLKSKAVIVYLKVSPHVAAKRVGSGHGRPLLEGRDAGRELQEIIRDRNALYEKAADFVVDADEDVGRVAERIVAAVGLGAASTPPLPAGVPGPN